MSQRLHIGKTTDEDIYDCVLVSEQNAYQKMLKDWLDYDEKRGWFWGPWTISIGDTKLFDRIEPEIARLFEWLNLNYPRNIWMFKHEKRKIEHPTKEELENWCVWRKHRTMA